METLLYQTVRRLPEPPLVIAPAGSGAPDVRVRGVRTTLAARAAYRTLWTLHPSLYYSAAWLPSALRAVREWRPEIIQVGHAHLAPLGWLLARRCRISWAVYAYGQEVWRGGARVGRSPLDERLRGRALRSADVVFTPG